MKDTAREKLLFFPFKAVFSINFAVKTKKIIERKIFVLYINICAPYVRGVYDNFITKRGSAW